jgi:hypothetical protein
MKSKFLHAALAAALGAALLAPRADAYQVAEVRGDFYYDAQGNLIGHRDAELPANFERRPMSHKEKFELMGLQLPERRTYLEPRQVFAKPARVDDRDGMSRDKVIVKFVEGMPVRLRQGRLTVGNSAIPEVESIVAKYPDATLHRCFDAEERILDENKESGERISGKELADLNNFYIFTFDSPSQRGVDLANELLALDIVEIAYLQAAGTTPGPCIDVAPVTPSWVANQTYLDPAPTGLDAEYAWAYHAGGDGWGPGYWVADLEWEWCYTHEDLPIAITDVLNGNNGSNVDFMNHGTAVLGEIGACANAYGMTGITPDVTLKMCDFDSELSWAANVQEADAWLVSGEIMLLEIHILGPDSGLICPCNCGQFEYVPVEWDVATYNAISTATANGIIVVEAAGNGSMNLDSAIYGGWFNPAHDSGAIMVGAGVPGSHSPECWTNSGARVNVHGWGSSIYTTGYGFLSSQAGCPQDYDNGFGGTSGASPMIVGASAALQGISKLKYGVTLSPAQMRTTLPVGGTPQGAPLTRNIGPMPDLVDAINWIEPDVVASYTPAGWSFPALPRSTADSNGGFAPLQAGALPGNTSNNYLNWTERNEPYSYTPTVGTPYPGIYIEDNLVYWCVFGNLGVGGWNYCANAGAFVKGGRHTILNRADVFGTESEWAEWNNDWSRQYIWSPLALATNVPVTRSYDPTKTSTGYGPFYNAEGFSGVVGGNYWGAFAIAPADAATDHDIYLNTETPMNIPQQGFGLAVAQSGSGGDYTDFVVVDRNTVPGGTYYASGINWAGTGNKLVEFDMDQGFLGNPGVYGPFTLGAGEIVDLHETFLFAGQATRIQIQWLSGNANYGLTVHYNASGYSSKWGYIAGGYSDYVGPGGDEYVNVTDAAGHYHGIAVWKSNSDDLNESVSYNLIIAQLPNLTDATPIGWYGPVVPRNTTDATNNNAPLPATLSGNTPTTSYNFSTLNQGPPAVPAPWETRLFVDDFWMWYGLAPGSTAAGAFAQWINTSQGLDPYSIVRGGRHHLRLDADAGLQVAELPETDNTFVDWFSWSPLALAPNTKVTRNAPPVKDPVGFGPDYSCDGFSSDFYSYWTAVGVLPATNASDYDVRTHNAYVGSKDGFNSYIDWSGNATDGAVDFAIVNYNVAGAVPDFSILNWQATTDPFSVERAEADNVLIANPGINVYGPFGEGANDVLDMFEMYVPAVSVGLAVNISLVIDGGTANMGIKLYDGTQPYHNVFTATAEQNTGGPGVDEHLPAVVYGSSGFHGIAVHKTNATDLPLSATYRIVIAVGTTAVDAPPVDVGPAPSAFALSAPRPNPFSRSTAIELAVPADRGKAEVSIFDLQGRRIATIAENMEKAGRHLLTWDGRDSAGNDVAAGIYFVVLEAADFQETKKITLLR